MLSHKHINFFSPNSQAILPHFFGISNNYSSMTPLDFYFSSCALSLSIPQLVGDTSASSSSCRLFSFFLWWLNQYKFLSDADRLHPYFRCACRWWRLIFYQSQNILHRVLLNGWDLLLYLLLKLRREWGHHRCFWLSSRFQDLLFKITPSLLMFSWWKNTLRAPKTEGVQIF